MRRMYSEKQIKNLIEEDLSNVVVTKGKYTSEAHIKMTRVGHCITIAGFVIVNNTSENIVEAEICSINIPVSLSVDGDQIALIKTHEDITSFADGYITSYENAGLSIAVNNIPTGKSFYNFDIDIIDDKTLPVKDYPGE